jgi:hypothetical protein
MLGGWISQQFPPPPPSPVLPPSLKEKESDYYLVLHQNLKSTARRRWRRVTKTPHSLNKIASFQEILFQRFISLHKRIYRKQVEEGYINFTPSPRLNSKRYNALIIIMMMYLNL